MRKRVLKPQRYQHVFSSATRLGLQQQDAPRLISYATALLKTQSSNTSSIARRPHVVQTLLGTFTVCFATSRPKNQHLDQYYAAFEFLFSGVCEQFNMSVPLNTTSLYSCNTTVPTNSSTTSNSSTTPTASMMPYTGAGSTERALHVASIAGIAVFVVALASL